jgi:protein-S-isoprenylcysteine O-methyltransferase Ste14
MKRHPVEPGKLVAGLVVLGVAAVYGLDAAGEGDVRSFAPLMLLVGGLCLAGVVSTLTYSARRRRARGTERSAP